MINSLFNVALVIPTLNEEKFIKGCLCSVRKQTYPFDKMDVIVVDGGSTDRTCEIVKEISKEYPNIRLMHNPKKIQSAAFNIGVRCSNAPYIIRLDAHATYSSNYVEKCLKSFSSTNEKLGCTPTEIGNVGGVWHIQPQHSGLIAEASALLNQSRFGIGGAAFRVGAPSGFADTVPFGCFPRSVVERIGGMDEELPRGEDNEYNYRLRSHGYKIWFDSEIIANYFARDTVKDLMKQMYANGYSIGKLIRKNYRIVSLRHLVPMCFVASLLVLTLSSIIAPPILILLAAVLLLYLLCALAAAATESMKHGIRFMTILPVMFFLVHLSYGWGTLVGLVRKKY